MVAQDTAEVVRRPRKVVVRKWTVRVIVALSLIWTFINLVFWDGLAKVTENLKEGGIFISLILLCEIIFVVGAALVAAGGGKEVFRGTGFNPVRWVGAALKVREGYRKIAEHAPDSKIVRLGFNLNWLGAVGTGVVAALGIMVVLPVSAWGLLVLPVIDIVASFGWRIPVQRKWDAHDAAHHPKPLIRSVTLADVPGLVALDAARYGEIAESTTDNPTEMFTKRIQNSEGFFWVAEFNGEIIGLLSAQRSKYGPDEFISWDQCTNHGSFEGTGDSSSPVLYVAAMTTQEGLPHEWMVFERLFAYGLGTALARGAKRAFFSGRMPGYHEWHLAHPEGTPEEYYNARAMHNGREVALDWQIRHYESFGMKRVRLVENGFAEDWESEGYSVLFTLDFPMAGKPLPRLWGWLFQLISKHPKMLKHL